MFLRLAYIALIAASIALRLAFAYPQASASNLAQRADKAATVSATQSNASAQELDAAPLITGRSVAAPTSHRVDEMMTVERRARDGVGAAGFARR